jgi:pimeloyl-ACP methyl ester carboxylesterase
MKRRTSGLAALLVVITTLAALLVIALVLPVNHMKNLKPPEALADPDSQFVEINRIQVHLKVAGEGKPVFVLLHGFAASLYTWSEVLDDLAPYGTVIAYDRTGFGLSERPLDWQGLNPYSAEAQVELLISLLDHFGVEQAILVGNSAGGTLAVQAALAHPERVSALILVDPAVYTGGGAPQWLKPVLATAPARRLGILVTRQMLNRGPQLIKLAWHEPARLSEDMLEYYQKLFQVEHWDQALWEYTLASQPAHLAAHLDELKLPVLVITGDDDRIVPTADSIRLAEELPDARLEVIAEAGHVPHEERPLEFMQAVNRFLNQTIPEE